MPMLQVNAKAIARKKILAKTNWFKGSRQEDEGQPKRSRKPLVASPAKKQRLEISSEEHINTSIQQECSDEELIISSQGERSPNLQECPEEPINYSIQQEGSEEELLFSNLEGSQSSNLQECSVERDSSSRQNRVMKDGKLFQKIYSRARRGKEKGKVIIKLKRLYLPRKTGVNGATVTPSTPYSLDEQVEHQEGADSISMDQGVTIPQTEQVDDDVVVEDSFQLEEEAMGPGLDVQDEVLSYDGEWMDSWRSDKN